MSCDFLDKGWRRFPFDPILADWVEAALPAARAAVVAPENIEWLRCGGSWFVGVNALPNDPDGAVAGGPPVSGLAYDFIRGELKLHGFQWDRAQISVCYPGYPQPSESESADAFRFRLHRDAAHVDGLLAEGPDRRRHLREHHGFVLGIPMVDVPADAAPLVVWEGSHEIIREAFQTVFGGIAPDNWGDVNVTEPYKAVRQKVFDTCERVEVHAKPGEAYLVHRLAVHGVAPWSITGPLDDIGPDGRMIAYFRPTTGPVRDWLDAP